MKQKEKVSPEILSLYRQKVNGIIAARLRIIVLSGAVLFMGYSYVDRLVYPEHEIEFLIMRIILCASFIVYYFLSYWQKIRKHIVWLSDIAILEGMGGIAYIIYRTNGAQSEYYTGLNLIFMAYFVANSFYYKHSIVVGLLTVAMYTVAVLCNPTPLDSVQFFYAHYFIDSAIFFVVLMTWLFQREYFRGFVLQLKLDVLYQQADMMSKTDDLTQIFNRRHFFIVLEEKLKSCREFGTFFYLVIFDIDHFKQINDNYGHMVGDKAIQHIAKAVADNVRNQSYIGRYGGDEFLILIDKAEKDVFMARISEIKRAVEAAPFMHDGKLIKISISIGAVRVDPSKFSTALQAIERADLALITIKQRARGEINLLE